MWTNVGYNHQWVLVTFTRGNFTRNAPDVYHWYEFEDFKFDMASSSASGRWVHLNSFCCSAAPGPVSLTVFPSQFKFDGNFVSLSPRFYHNDRYKILYMARQLCCRGMCKNLLRSDGQQRSYGKAKFPSNLNCGQKTVSETGPRPRLQLFTSSHRFK